MQDATAPAHHPPSPRPGGHRGGWLYPSLAIALGCLVAVALVEFGVRVSQPRSLAPPVTVAHPDYNHALRPGLRVRVEVTPEKYPVDLRTNALGLAQAREVASPRPADILRVLVLGDSFVQGLGEGQNLPALVEQALTGWRSADGRRLEFVNGGTQSYSALLHRARWRHQLAHTRPDVVIVFPDLTDVYDDAVRYRPLAEHAGNELVRVRPSAAMRMRDETRRVFGYDHVPLHAWKYVVAGLADRRARALARDDDERRIFAHALDDPAAPSAATRTAVAYATAQVDALVRQLRQDGAHVALMVYPHEAQLAALARLGEHGTPARLNRLFADALAALAARRAVPYAAFFAPFADALRNGHALYFDGDMHFNVHGLNLLAQRVSATLRDHGAAFLGSALVPAADAH
ncbi:MAG: SGNH/GDSL hydrolase family protein [Gammaproteobacteria bacterium]